MLHDKNMYNIFNRVFEASLTSWLLLVSGSSKYFPLNLNNLFTILVLSLVSQFSLLSPWFQSNSLSQHWLKQLLAIAVYWEAIKFLNENSNYIDKLSSVYSLDWNTGLQCFIVYYVITVYVMILHKCINEWYNR